MGNQACCKLLDEQKNELSITNEESENQSPGTALPKLSEPVRIFLKRQKPFKKQLPKKSKRFELGRDIYCGDVDNRGRPHGFGQIYFLNGSVFVGQLKNGNANGQGVYIKSDGSYYRGSFINNEAKDQSGYYWSDNFEYKGGFEGNEFHGEAEETGSNYKFIGIYQKNQKKSGKLIWQMGTGISQNEYYGYFDQNGKFSGKGTLINVKGMYEGDFKNGEKHGEGTFYYNSGCKFIGNYKYGRKQGKGKVLNEKEEILYEGTFKNNILELTNTQIQPEILNQN